MSISGGQEDYKNNLTSGPILNENAIISKFHCCDMQKRIIFEVIIKRNINLLK
jgi:hypothetical protein